MKPTLDTNDITKKLQKLVKAFKPDQPTMKKAMRFSAEWMLGMAQNKAPVDQGSLGASSSTQEVKDGVEFGFNTSYAAVQDLGFKGEKLRPRKAKALYVPISDKGRRYHTLGKNPATEGLMWGIDYVLAGEVQIRNKPYGSDRGPNKYFSETLERNKETIFKIIRDKLKAEMDGLL